MCLRKVSQFVLCTAIVSISISANSEEVNFGTRIPTTLELIELLAPKEKGQTTKYRGIELDKDGANASSDAIAEQPAEDPNSASLQVLFAFDSYELTPAALDQLHPLGMALQSAELTGLSFLVEGHTDAVGSDTYNMTLSERRAMTIKRHLVQNYKIPSQHLEAVGKGETNLLRPSAPRDGANRRVRIIGSE